MRLSLVHLLGGDLFNYLKRLRPEVCFDVDMLDFSFLYFPVRNHLPSTWSYFQLNMFLTQGKLFQILSFLKYGKEKIISNLEWIILVFSYYHQIYKIRKMIVNGIKRYVKKNKLFLKLRLTWYPNCMAYFRQFLSGSISWKLTWLDFACVKVRNKSFLPDRVLIMLSNKLWKAFLRFQ